MSAVDSQPVGRPRRVRLLIAAGVVLILGLALVGVWWFTNPAHQLTEAYEGPASLSLRYPNGWMAVIPDMGMMVVADPDTIGGTPGPSLTIQRSTQLMFQDGPTGALEYYLAHGPEIANRQWTRVTDIQTTTLHDGRTAATIDLRGRAFESDPETYIRLVVTEANNSVIYVLGLSAPPGQWSEAEALLMAILDSIEFTE